MSMKIMVEMTLEDMKGCLGCACLDMPSDMIGSCAVGYWSDDSALDLYLSEEYGDAIYIRPPQCVNDNKPNKLKVELSDIEMLAESGYRFDEEELEYLGKHLDDVNFHVVNFFLEYHESLEHDTGLTLWQLGIFRACNKIVDVWREDLSNAAS